MHLSGARRADASGARLQTAFRQVPPSLTSTTPRDLLVISFSLCTDFSPPSPLLFSSFLFFSSLVPFHSPFSPACPGIFLYHSLRERSRPCL